MSDEDDADCAFSMRKGVRKVEQKSVATIRKALQRRGAENLFNFSKKWSKNPVLLRRGAENLGSLLRSPLSSSVQHIHSTEHAANWISCHLA
jgi:hypothetical protein